MNGIEVKALFDQLNVIANKKSDSDRQPHDFGTGITVYHSEIELIETLEISGGQSMTKIAEIMGITKGAVSQTFKKLEEKGLVRKYHDPVNASRFLLYLTSNGKQILKEHRLWHQEINRGFNEYISKLEPASFFLIKDFLSRYEVALEN